jgi:hypothetical protein
VALSTVHDGRAATVLHVGADGVWGSVQPFATRNGETTSALDFLTRHRATFRQAAAKTSRLARHVRKDLPRGDLGMPIVRLRRNAKKPLALRQWNW